MAGFAWSRGICVLCLVLLCQSPGRAADADPDVEKQLLKAIAEGDLAEVENLATGLDLSKITNFYYHVLNSPNAEVVDFLRERLRQATAKSRMK